MSTVDHVGGPGIRRPAAYVAAMFGGCWWISGARLVGGWAALVLSAAGVVVVAALVYAVRRNVQGGTDSAGLPRAGSRYVWINVGQLAGFAAAVVIVRHFHVAGVAAALIAIVVGLHFLPLAWAFTWQPYLWTGAGLIAAGIAGILVYEVGARWAATTVVCAAVAVVLWAAAATAAVRRAGS